MKMTHPAAVGGASQGPWGARPLNKRGFGRSVTDIRPRNIAEFKGAWILGIRGGFPQRRLNSQALAIVPWVGVAG